MFGRSGHCPGIIYDEEQHITNSKKGLPNNFLYFDIDSKLKLNKKQRAYINEGEKLELNKRYKCRIRKPWYKVPSVYNTSLGLLKRCHNFPRLIYNRLKLLRFVLRGLCLLRKKDLIFCINPYRK